MNQNNVAIVLWNSLFCLLINLEDHVHFLFLFFAYVLHPCLNHVCSVSVLHVCVCVFCLWVCMHVYMWHYMCKLGCIFPCTHEHVYKRLYRWVCMEFMRPFEQELWSQLSVRPLTLTSSTSRLSPPAQSTLLNLSFSPLKGDSTASRVKEEGISPHKVEKRIIILH